ncbi:hypothetical protein [Arenibacter algicola]|uniref:hypothetical protein n=1 Tax=Arenibacter algicola TaxID=616991 RepID=UPI00115156B2
MFIVLVFTEVVVKNLVYGQSPGEAFKSIRIGLPLFSSLILIVQGIRADVRIVWKTLLMAICVSEILSYISLVIDLPIYHGMEGSTNILEEKKGRLGTANSTFGIIGLYLLFEDKNKWYNQGRLVKITAVLSLIGLLLGFNRTYLALLFLEGVYLTRRQFNVKKVLKILFFVGLILGMGVYIYNTNDIIKRQIDKRILSIVLGETDFKEATIESNRDVIYDHIEARIKEDHWVIGLPYKKPIFIYYSIENEYLPHLKTDMSFINILLRYGFLVLLLCFVILYLMYRNKNFIPIIFWVYFLASLNIDSLLNQNSVFFLFFFSFIINSNHNFKELR